MGARRMGLVITSPHKELCNLELWVHPASRECRRVGTVGHGLGGTSVYEKRCAEMGIESSMVLVHPFPGT